MNQEFKDRVANLLIDARVNAVLAEATSDDGVPNPQSSRLLAAKRKTNKLQQNTIKNTIGNLQRIKFEQASVKSGLGLSEEFKDRVARVANLLIDARVNAVLAEVTSDDGVPLFKKLMPEKHPQAKMPIKPRAEAIRKRYDDYKAEQAKKAAAAGTPKPENSSTINQDFMDRLINIIMEKKVGDLGQRNAAADTARRLKKGEGKHAAEEYIKAFKDRASGKPMAEGNRSKALKNATDPATIEKLKLTSKKAREKLALKTNKPGNVALNQMLGVVESSKPTVEDNKKKPMIKIDHKGPIGYKIAAIGPGRTEHNVRTGDGWKEPTDKPKPSSPKS